MKRTILEKLTSRKFIVTVITAIAGVITAIIGESETLKIIVGAAMTVIPTIVYCITEGVLDAKSVKTIAEATADAAEKLGAKDNVVDVIEQAGEIGEILIETKEK
jgi:hypothetical protein